ncbi:MAG: hypothetical protein ABDH28_05810 [Brevinematia bacterium]
MRRLTFLIILVSLGIVVYASESRLVGMGGSYILIDDPFNIVYLPGYVNKEYNYLIIEPRQGSLGIFDNTYGILKYSINTPLEKLNIGAIINFPYRELGFITEISTGIPAGFLVTGTTGLQPFTITDHRRDKADLLCGLSGILMLRFLKPYVGLGYASDHYVSTTSTYQNESVTTTVTNIQSISQIKLIAGSVVDLNFVSVDASVKLYLPSARNSTESFNTTIQNYVNSRVHKTEGAFGFEISAQPMMKLGDKSYALGMFGYFNYGLPSAQTTRIDANGDGTLEEDTKIQNNYQTVEIVAGGSYNTYIGSVLVSAGAMLLNRGYYRTIKAEGTVINVVGIVTNVLTNTNEQVSQTSYVYVPAFVAFELPLADWFLIRSGVMKDVYQVSSSVTDGRKFNSSTQTSDSSSPITSLSVGFTLKPMKDLSLDWVVSYTFVSNVIVNGSLPWIISGNNRFDNLTSQFSVEYRM